MVDRGLRALGAIAAIFAEFFSLWSVFVMDTTRELLADPSVAFFPGLAPTVRLWGVVIAYLCLPLVGGGMGRQLGSRLDDWLLRNHYVRVEWQTCPCLSSGNGTSGRPLRN